MKRNNEELVSQYKLSVDPERFDYKAAGYYLNNTRKMYEPLQQGTASPLNFFERTIVTYQETERPQGEPDFTSNSGSQYWYSEEGVIRGSDHWGNGVANCNWALKEKNGRTEYGLSYDAIRRYKDRRYGFARWQDFVLKCRIVEINGQEYLTSFDNTIGRDIVVIDGQKYRQRIVELWDETE